MNRLKKSTISSSITLTKKNIDFLDSLSQKSRHSSGIKLSKSSIVRALLSISKDLEIDVSNVKNQDELKDRIIEAFCKHN